MKKVVILSPETTSTSGTLGFMGVKDTQGFEYAISSDIEWHTRHFSGLAFAILSNQQWKDIEKLPIEELPEAIKKLLMSKRVRFWSWLQEVQQKVQRRHSTIQANGQEEALEI